MRVIYEKIAFPYALPCPMLSMGLSAHAGVLDQLIKQMEQSKTGQTDATSSASQKPVGKQEHISLGIEIPSLESFCGRELDVAFMIVCDGDNTHVYHSNDFNYDYWGDCFEEIDAVSSASRQ